MQTTAIFFLALLGGMSTNAAQTKFGSWGDIRPPLLNTWRSGDPLGLSSANISASLDEMLATNQKVVGLAVESCGSMEAFFHFAGNASARNLPLEIFGVLSCHNPISRYCPEYLSHDPALPVNNSLNVNWTRVGEVLGSRAASLNLGSTFRGVYIDDAYVAICTARGGATFNRGGHQQYPCVPMSTLEEMQTVLRETSNTTAPTRVDVIPLVYTKTAPEALPGGYALGAQAGAVFQPPMSTTVGFDIVPSSGSVLRSTWRSVASSSPCSLTFFYTNWLAEWPKGFRGFGFFSVLIDGTETVWSVDTHHGGGLLMANVTLPSRPSRSVEFVVTPTNRTKIDRHILRTVRVTGIWGIDLICGADHVIQAGRTAATIFKGGNESAGLLATSNVDSVAAGKLGTLLFLQEQEPDLYTTKNYTHKLTIAKNVTEAAGSKLWGGKYSRVGLVYTRPVSAVDLKQSIEIDTQLGLEASLVWNLPLPISRCRSEHDTCDQGVFAQRKHWERDGKGVISRPLFYPSEHIATPGWFQRYSTFLNVFEANNGKKTLTVKLLDQLRQYGPYSHGLYLDGIYKKQVYLVQDGAGKRQDPSNYTQRTYLFDAVMGYPHSAQAGSSSSSAACVGASPTVANWIQCKNSGREGATTTVTLTIPQDAHVRHSRLVVELALAEGVHNADATLLATLPKLRGSGLEDDGDHGWRYRSGLYDIMHPTLRELYNATLGAFGVN